MAAPVVLVGGVERVLELARPVRRQGKEGRGVRPGPDRADEGLPRPGQGEVDPGRDRAGVAGPGVVHPDDEVELVPLPDPDRVGLDRGEGELALPPEVHAEHLHALHPRPVDGRVCHLDRDLVQPAPGRPVDLEVEGEGMVGPSGSVGKWIVRDPMGMSPVPLPPIRRRTSVASASPAFTRESPIAARSPGANGPTVDWERTRAG